MLMELLRHYANAIKIGNEDLINAVLEALNEYGVDKIMADSLLDGLEK